MINVNDHVTRTQDSWIHLQGRSLRWSGPFDLVKSQQSTCSYQCIFFLLRDSSFGMMFSVVMQSNDETLDWGEKISNSISKQDFSRLHWHRVAVTHIELSEEVAWEVEIAEAVGSEASQENAVKRWLHWCIFWENLENPSFTEIASWVLGKIPDDNNRTSNLHPISDREGGWSYRTRLLRRRYTWWSKV